MRALGTFGTDRGGCVGLRRSVAALAVLVAVGMVAACTTTPPVDRPAPPSSSSAVELPGPPPPADAVVAIDRTRALHEFNGTAALGVGVDGLRAGEIDRVWTPANVALMKSAGYGPVSFRLRTELGSKAWHWSPHGSWSNPASNDGYWVSDPESPAGDLGVSHGYNLPRRGNTLDQANNDGYSRITDGDPGTFWKSNPYLDPHFTGEPDTEHPQWMMFSFVDQDGFAPVDTMVIDWGEPFARSVRVQYWQGAGDPIFPIEEGGHWTDFPTSSFTGTGGRQTLRLAPTPVDVTFVLVQLMGGSGTGPATTDIRDRLGFSVREVSMGSTVGGRFKDGVSHDHSHRQTNVYTSSTDPWHRESDLDEDYEHASLDRIVASGLAGQPHLMAAVPVLYGVPEDAAALLQYARDRGFPVERIEMGEEPDGQLAQPEHYAALYLQVAAALKVVDPTIQLGGPGYQTTLPDWLFWPDGSGTKSWTGRFVSFLKQRDRMGDFNFFSFEWYPFDDVCSDTGVAIRSNPGLLADLLTRQEQAGLPKDVPKVITELGYSAYAGRPEVELPGAIVDAETMTKFLELGGDTSFAYGIEPNQAFLEHEGRPCDSWGNLMYFQFLDDYQTRPLAAFEAARLLTSEWVQPGSGRHAVLAVSTTSPTAEGGPPVTAYAVRRPDGSVSVMVFNKDATRTLSVRLEDAQRPQLQLGEEMVQVQYSGEQYQWDPTPGEDSHGRPSKNLPPTRTTLDTRAGAVTSLPPNSITVIRFRER